MKNGAAVRVRGLGFGFGEPARLRGVLSSLNAVFGDFSRTLLGFGTGNDWEAS